ncbi:hypothetical protein [Pseudomonas viridiflava]|uniref:hypothetical protein n=1 Tax=Pseudomonas viridiflava TaxID=33069 RepID=UPI002B1E85E3|nr:hypothetical protein [Pseudomonas viridiflava]
MTEQYRAEETTDTATGAKFFRVLEGEFEHYTCSSPETAKLLVECLKKENLKTKQIADQNTRHKEYKSGEEFIHAKSLIAIEAYENNYNYLKKIAELNEISISDSTLKNSKNNKSTLSQTLSKK